MKSVFLLAASAFLSFLIFNPYYIPVNKINPQAEEITIIAAGDLMCHSPQFETARAGKDSFNFNQQFYYVKPVIEKADLAFANFETVLAGKERKYSGYPQFNTPDAFLNAVKEAGFNFLSTANNHAYDRGKDGVIKTFKKIRGAGINSAGTYNSKGESDSVVITEIKGIKLGILAYTQMLNGFKLPKGDNYLVNLIDTALVRKDIQRYKKAGADIVIVYFHFGEEYKRTPTPYQETIVKKTIAAGADIILASHPHVIEKLETFKPVNSKLDTGFTAYSLGNFISNQRWRYSDSGVMLNFTIRKKENGKLELKNIEIIPTWVFKGLLFAKDEFAVLPAGEAFSAKPLFFLKEGDIKKMKQSFYDTKEIMLKGLRLSPSKIKIKGNFPPQN